MESKQGHTDVTPPNNSDEVTLRELFLKIKEYYQEVVSKWKVIALIAFLFALFFVGKAYLKESTYTAHLTFMVNEDEGGRGGAISGLLGQFGFSGGGSGKFNLPKIIELARSRHIFENAIFDSCIINEKNDYIANHLIDLYELHISWVESDQLNGFYFQDSNAEAFGNTENSALLTLYDKTVGSAKNPGIYSTTFRDDTGILSMTTSCANEMISLFLTEAMYKSLSSFYIEKSIEKQESTYQLMKGKSDSILIALNSLQSRMLKFSDTHLGITLSQHTAPRLEMQRDIQVLTIAYGEAVKNVELADFALKNATVAYYGKKIINQINWTVKPGEKWALFGANGSGKSTLLALLFGDHPQAYANDIYLFDQKRGVGQNIWDIKKRTGFTSSELHFFFNAKLTAEETIITGLFDHVYLKRPPNSTEQELIDLLMDYFEVTPIKNRPFQHLSTGEQRIMLLIRALVKNPPLILLDEPFQGFDLATIALAKQLLNAILTPQHTLVFITHYEREIPKIVQKRFVFA